ncbi:autophagy-related protein 13b [Macadamia integrifolia]|uniref:autophagy-related protein 13b n=1 Tax=Macadamia integrifolia TaxID=60698 RepID=UPI001C4ED1AD|nr:autophagy-related protein 13b [Macadamia integrifolia]XP_042481861.1 autophagy-related protein 13b [Macadamia integrifolia]
MASSQSNLHSEPAKIEQIITEFFAKSLHIIIESRSPCVSSRNYSGEQTLSSPSPSSSLSSSSSIRTRDKWFNLALRDCPEALENGDLWRQSNLEPMVVDVILVQRQTDWDVNRCSPKRDLVRNLSLKERFPNCWNSGQEDYPQEMKSEKIIERWVVQYESRRSRDSSSSGSKRTGGTNSHSLYKKSLILLRSLYLTVRLLPAYKVFRELNSSGQIRSFSLAHRVCSFVEPFTRGEEAEMQKFVFGSVDISCGRLSLSVLYHPTLSTVGLEPSTPLSPQFIPDYVGSPTTDPLKRFPSPLIGLTPHGSAAFARRHSWSYDLFKASAPSGSPSPSPTYSEPHALPSNSNSNRLPPLSFPRHPPETPISHKNASFDEYWPSPTMSASPSPSPPTHYPGSHLSKVLLRSESAPVSIPAAKLGRSPGVPNSHILPPSPSPKNTRPGSSQIDNARTPMKFGEVQVGSSIHKMSFGKDEAGNLSGAKISSNSSPRISFSRSSSRLSFQDDFDDSDFCPFAVDDDDIVDPHTRAESFDGKGNLNEPFESGGLLPAKKSQDAAVGVLVQMLKTAPPLRHDFSNSIRASQASKPETQSKSIQEPDRRSNSEAGVVQNASSYESLTSSGLLMSKTTADALEELRSYREMKDLLLSQGSASQALASDVPAAETVNRGTKEL